MEVQIVKNKVKLEELKDYIKVFKKYLKRPLFVYDVETICPDAKTTEIVSFAGIKIKSNGEISTIDFLVKPSRPITDGASKINGLTNEAVAEKPPFSFYAQDLYDLIKDCDISGYNNLRFDDLILIRQLKECGFELTNYTSYDSYPIYLKNHRRKLSDALQYYCNENLEKAHTAIADVTATAKIIASQIEKEQLPLHEVIAKYEKDEKSDISKYIIKDSSGDEVWCVGKAKGQKLKDIDKGYLAWILKSDFSPEVKKIITKYTK